jgi:two-component system response regulator MtrA
MNSYEGPSKDRPGQPAATPDNPLNGQSIPKIFVLCDRSDTLPLWGYVVRQQGLIAILETDVDRALDHWATEMPELVVIDLNNSKTDPLELCKQFRGSSVAPLLLFLPTYHETLILDAYAAGVDDVVVKPISPPIVMAKLMAWLRRSWVMPTDGLESVKVGKYRLVPVLRSLVDPNDIHIRLTNLEFRMLHLLMSRPGHVFLADEIIQSIWGGYGNGDNVLLKNVVYRLRRKIEEDPANPCILRTWPGGYSFQG